MPTLVSRLRQIFLIALAVASNKRKKFSLKSIRNHKGLLIFLIVVIVLVVVRIILPPIALKIINQKVDRVGDYHVHINDLDLHILKAALDLKDISVTEYKGPHEHPFAFIKDLYLGIYWSALLKGKVRGQIGLEKPDIDYVLTAPQKKEVKEAAKKVSERPWQEDVKKLLPIRIDYAWIHDGIFCLKDAQKNPPPDLCIKNIEVGVVDITNRPTAEEKLPTRITMDGITTGDGKIHLTSRADVLAEPPLLDLNFQLKSLNLAALNDFLRGYADFDIQKGDTDVFIEAATSKGYFEGYVKPVIRGLDVFDWDDAKKKSFGKVVKEAFIGGIASILKNHKKNQLAAKIPFRGKLENPKADIADTIFSVLRNGFIKALIPSLDHSLPSATKLPVKK